MVSRRRNDGPNHLELHLHGITWVYVGIAIWSAPVHQGILHGKRRSLPLPTVWQRRRIGCPRPLSYPWRRHCRRRLWGIQVSHGWTGFVLLTTLMVPYLRIRQSNGSRLRGRPLYSNGAFGGSDLCIFICMTYIMGQMRGWASFSLACST